MLIAKVLAATLVVNVAAAPAVEPTESRLSPQQKSATAQTYVDAAIDCVARAVSTDPRFQRENPALKLGELIEQSLPKCQTQVRAMINALDLHFGPGMGENFVSGPYRAALPDAVVELVTANRN